jgi:CDP-glucose 4,6-dehydratase
MRIAVFCSSSPTIDKKYVELAHELGKAIGEKNWELEKSLQPHEASYLLLDSSKARKSLSWSDKLDFETAIDLTAQWFKRSLTESPREITLNQIKKFISLN